MAWSEETERCRVLEQRRAWCELMIRADRDARGHLARESDALAWALSILERTEDYVEHVAEARRLVARKPPQLRESA